MKVGSLIWSNPDLYQAVIYISQILSENGHNVEILCRNTDESFLGNVNYGKGWLFMSQLT